MPFPSSVSQQFANFVHSLSFRELPLDVVEMVKARLLDAVTTAIEARGLPVPSTALKWVGTNQGRATVFGHDVRLPAVDAALVNATLINGCTHDDFLYKSHAAATTIPAALAIAEEQERSGAELITAILAGYELSARAYLGAPGMLPDFRSTGVAGGIGAAAAAGKMLGLPVPGLMNALGYAAMFASGFGEGFLHGTMDVKFNVGWASRNGVSAAMLAYHGATAAPTVFEGGSGYFKAFSGTTEHAPSAVQDLGGRLLIEDLAYKDCPIGVCVQTPVHLARTLADGRTLDPALIRKVSVSTSADHYNNPGFRNPPPYENALQVRISALFCVAAALLGRPVRTYAYYDNYNDPEVLALIARIELVPPTSGEGGPVSIVVDYDGEQLSAQGLDRDTLRPTTARIVDKFQELAAGFFGVRAQQVLDTVLNLERLDNVTALTRLLRGPATHSA